MGQAITKRCLRPSCHPGAAQRSPGSITTDDPRLRGDDSVEIHAAHLAPSPGTTSPSGMIANIGLSSPQLGLGLFPARRRAALLCRLLLRLLLDLARETLLQQAQDGRLLGLEGGQILPQLRLDLLLYV